MSITPERTIARPAGCDRKEASTEHRKQRPSHEASAYVFNFGVTSRRAKEVSSKK